MPGVGQIWAAKGSVSERRMQRAAGHLPGAGRGNRRGAGLRGGRRRVPAAAARSAARASRGRSSWRWRRLGPAFGVAFSLGLRRRAGGGGMLLLTAPISSGIL